MSVSFFLNFLRENPDPTQKIRKPKISGSCRILLISGSRPLKTIQFLSSGLKYFRVVANYSVASQALDQRSGRVLKIFGFLHTLDGTDNKDLGFATSKEELVKMCP